MGFVTLLYDIPHTALRGINSVPTIGAITKFILRYGRTNDSLGVHNKRTKDVFFLMMFFYYKTYLELSKINNHNALIIKQNF